MVTPEDTSRVEPADLHPEGAPRGIPGVDIPDARGRTGLDKTGLDLRGNPRVRVRGVELLASAWHVLRRTTLDYQGDDGEWSTQQRETYDRGNGATVLLYDAARRTVLLTRQFRFPVYVNGHPDGMLIETAAGLLDDDDPETAIRREAAEETGVQIGELAARLRRLHESGLGHRAAALLRRAVHARCAHRVRAAVSSTRARRST